MMPTMSIATKIQVTGRIVSRKKNTPTSTAPTAPMPVQTG